MAVAIKIRHTDRSPTGRQRGPRRAADVNVVVQIPDRGLARAGIVKQVVRFGVAVKIRYADLVGGWNGGPKATAATLLRAKVLRTSLGVNLRMLPLAPSATNRLSALSIASQPAT